MRGRGFASQWLYGPDKQVRLPAWLETEVRAFCHRREVERFRAEVRELGSAIAAVEAMNAPPVPRSKSHEKKLVQAQSRAARKRR